MSPEFQNGYDSKTVLGLCDTWTIPVVRMDTTNDGLVEVILRRSCSLLVILLLCIPDILGDWCSQDTGYHTVTDNSGIPHNAYISATRDGSIWIRVGLDGKAQDWMYTHENKITTKVTLMPPETIDMIEALGYTDFCVLTDLQLDLHTYAGWHPSYVKAYYPRDRLTKLMILRKNPESQPCQVNTTLSLTSDGQALTCSGGQAHTCGYRHLPEKGQVTPNIFLEYIQLDPRGDGHKLCNGTPSAINSYTLFGSYYHVYVKMAKCKPPRDSRWFGHEAVLRPLEDRDRDVVVIPDPQQTALADGVIVAWRIYAKVISVEHNVSLEVWRPSNTGRNEYTLIGNTFVIPRLRFQLEPIQPSNYIRIRQGDVLAIYYPEKNPIPWSPVPCAYPAQRHLFLEHPSDISVGRTLRFTQSDQSRTACRHYSVTAVLANKTNSKVIQDWICPSASPPHDEHQGAERKTEPVLNNRNHKKSNSRKTLISRPGAVDDAVLPVHLILIIIGSLLLLLCVIGFASYYHAMKS